MSNGQPAPTVPDTTYYDYLVETANLARLLTERLVFMEESALAANANLLRSQLSQMVDANLSDQVQSVPLPTYE